MDKGAAVEYDTPENLFKQGGIFYSMCSKSNITIEDLEVSSACSPVEQLTDDYQSRSLQRLCGNIVVLT
jgi:hypothetical protein